jgi:hypothetical protein
MNKIIKFHNLVLKVTASLKDDPSRIVSERMRATASIDKVVDDQLILAKAQESFCQLECFKCRVNKLVC